MFVSISEEINHFDIIGKVIWCIYIETIKNVIQSKFKNKLFHKLCFL